MGVEIRVGEYGANFICTTGGKAFGPDMAHPQGNCREWHREIAEEVAEECRSRGLGIREAHNKDELRGIYVDVKDRYIDGEKSADLEEAAV